MRKNTQPKKNSPLAMVDITSRARMPAMTNMAHPTRKKIQPVSTNFYPVRIEWSIRSLCASQAHYEQWLQSLPQDDGTIVPHAEQQLAAD